MAGSTANIGDAATEAKGKAEETVEQPWVEALMRFGYAVRGMLYIIVGILAVQVALGRGGATTDKGGAITAIGQQPFGGLLLVLTIVGLAGYSLWGFVRAILDPFKRGTDPKGIAQRLGYVVSALSYGALILPAVRFLIRDNKGGSGGAQDWTANLIQQPWGKWLVVAFGVVGMVGGLGQLWQAFSAEFQKDFKFAEMSEQAQTWARRAGRFGYAARGVIFAIGGFFLSKAALDANPKETKGLDGALQTLAQQPYGPWLLGLVALGLVSFGVYSVLCAKWIKLKREA